MLFQTCLINFLMQNTTADIIKNIFAHTVKVNRVQNSNGPHWLSLYGPKKKYIYILQKKVRFGTARGWVNDDSAESMHNRWHELEDGRLFLRVYFFWGVWFGYSNGAAITHFTSHHASDLTLFSLRWFMRRAACCFGRIMFSRISELWSFSCRYVLSMFWCCSSRESYSCFRSRFLVCTSATRSWSTLCSDAKTLRLFWTSFSLIKKQNKIIIHARYIIKWSKVSKILDIQAIILQLYAFHDAHPDQAKKYTTINRNSSWKFCMIYF